ncbi:MAG: homoserine kinase [Porticoccaceae bacterium]
MAVYTHISPAQLDQALRDFGLQLEGAPRGVADGIENSTYFFDASDGAGRLRPLVLSIIEDCPLGQLQYACALTTCLNNAALPVPAPLRGRDHRLWFEIAGKPALIVPRMAGAHMLQPSSHECGVIGDYLARAHLAAAGLPDHFDNRRGLAWLEQAQTVLAPVLAADDSALLDEEIRRYRRLARATLPRGAIHADLFRDNALFEGRTLRAVIDFLFACTDWWLLDLAIAVNDWCATTEAPGFDGTRAAALLGAYARARPFSRDEHQCWQDMLCITATRFWVSRLLAAQSADQCVNTKDPDEYRTLLRYRRETFPTLPDAGLPQET